MTTEIIKKGIKELRQKEHLARKALPFKKKRTFKALKIFTIILLLLFAFGYICSYKKDKIPDFADQYDPNRLSPFLSAEQKNYEYYLKNKGTNQVLRRYDPWISTGSDKVLREYLISVDDSMLNPYDNPNNDYECASHVQFTAERVLGQRAIELGYGQDKSGVGDSWLMGKNIEAHGGKRYSDESSFSDPNIIKPLTMIAFYNPKSSYHKQSNAAGEDYTHAMMVVGREKQTKSIEKETYSKEYLTSEYGKYYNHITLYVNGKLIRPEQYENTILFPSSKVEVEYAIVTQDPGYRKITIEPIYEASIGFEARHAFVPNPNKVNTILDQNFNNGVEIFYTTKKGDTIDTIADKFVIGSPEKKQTWKNRFLKLNNVKEKEFARGNVYAIPSPVLPPDPTIFGMVNTVSNSQNRQINGLNKIKKEIPTKPFLKLIGLGPNIDIEKAYPYLPKNDELLAMTMAVVERESSGGTGWYYFGEKVGIEVNGIYKTIFGKDLKKIKTFGYSQLSEDETKKLLKDYERNYQEITGMPIKSRNDEEVKEIMKSEASLLATSLYLGKIKQKYAPDGIKTIEDTKVIAVSNRGQNLCFHASVQDMLVELGYMEKNMQLKSETVSSIDGIPGKMTYDALENFADKNVITEGGEQPYSYYQESIKTGSFENTIAYQVMK